MRRFEDLQGESVRSPLLRPCDAGRSPAQFTYAAVNRGGRHVVAPFVDLWLPR